MAQITFSSNISSTSQNFAMEKLNNLLTGRKIEDLSSSDTHKIDSDLIQLAQREKNRYSKISILINVLAIATVVALSAIFTALVGFSAPLVCSIPSLNYYLGGLSILVSIRGFASLFLNIKRSCESTCLNNYNALNHVAKEVSSAKAHEEKKNLTDGKNDTDRGKSNKTTTDEEKKVDERAVSSISSKEEVKDPYDKLLATQEDRKNIVKLFTELGTWSYMKMGWNRSYLEESGKKIKHVHPLKFLEVLATEPEMKKHTKVVSTADLMKEELLRNFENDMNEKFQKEGVDQHIEGFSKHIGVDSTIIRSFFNEKDWRGLLIYVINH